LEAADGEQLSVVGGPGDPWIVTATLVSGPSGATIEGAATASFVNGFVNFTGLLLSNKGSGYSVKFELTYPDNLNIPSVTSRQFITGPRPLGLVIENIEDQVPEAEIAAVKFSIYDLGLQQKATPEVIGALTWECSLGWSINTPVGIEGNKSTSITQAGANAGEFSVIFKQAKTSVSLKAECSAKEEERILTGTSNVFNIFPDRRVETGIFSLTTTAIKYSGPFTFIKAVIDAVPSLAIEECVGADCPAPASSRRRRRGLMDIRMKREAIAEEKSGKLTLSSYQLNANPTCIRPDGKVQC